MLQDIKNWKLIPTETYKSILESAKVRYEELMSQSMSITGKMEKIVIMNGAFMAWNAKVIVDKKDNISYCVLFILLALTLSVFGYLMISFFGRKAVFLGTKPEDTLGNEKELAGYDSSGNYSEQEKEKVYYYLQCFMYNNRITKFEPTLENRAIQLKTSLILTFIVFCASVALFVMTNF